MIYLSAAVFILFSFLFSYLITRWTRHYALAKNIIDIPNSRSSHVVPTPRGGGISFVISFATFGAALALTFESEFFYLVGIIIAGTLAAVIGFLDDHGHIPARWRLLSHFSCAAILLYSLGGPPPLQILGFEFGSTWWSAVFAAFFVVWMLNLYNFMDGIDGLASVQVISVAVGGAILFYLNGQIEFSLPPILLAASVGGFLVWNFPPARIFMGDAGSGFLGVILAAFTLQAAWIAPELFWSWLILSGVFIVDATYTLLRRLARGDKVYEAHRSHAYQIASRLANSHRTVTLSIFLINTLWLFPLSLLPVLTKTQGSWVLFIAYTPLIILVFLLKAGQRND